MASNTTEQRFGIQELIPVRVEECHYPVSGNRLNLVIPALSAKWSSGGGPATAIRLFKALLEHFEHARVVITHETQAQFDFGEWPGWSLDGDSGTRSIALLGDRSTSLSVAAGDLFLATFWSTALYVRHILARQAQWYPNAPRRFAYLIQDFEPSFYAWSAEYVFAKQTYLNCDDVIAVFNTQFLSDYFRNGGHRFSGQYVFEPMLNPRLRQKWADARGLEKERLILVYGRPSVSRNGFGLIVEALRVWADTFPGAIEWTLVSAGEQHPDVYLGKGMTLQSRGKVTLDEYAQHLSRCWVGLSLMFSPHPSYPPLELAEFGAWAITNAFENKDLSALAPNIISVDPLTPEEIAAKLAWSCEQYRPAQTTVIADCPGVFKSEGVEFPFAPALVESWRLAKPAG